MSDMEIAEFIALRLDEIEATAARALPSVLTVITVRDVEAKRLIVDLHARVHNCPVIIPVSNPGAFPEGKYVSTEYIDDDPAVSPCTTLRAIAAVYSDHPDYRDAWKP